MNPDIPKTPREELEARLTALLLGELPAEEAFALGRAIEQDAELARLYARLKETISLVKETSATPIRTSAPPLKLSQTRREKLLAQFKTVKPKQFVEAEKPGKSWINALAAAAVVMLLGALAMPNFIKTRTTSQSNAIINNLRQLDGAKQQWALENHKSAIDEPTMNDLEPYLRNNFPSIAGEKYVVGRVGEPVAADLDSSRAKKAFGEHAGTRVITRGGAQRLELAGEPLAVVPRQLNRPGDSQREIVAETPGGAKTTEPNREVIALPLITNANAAFAGEPQRIGTLNNSVNSISNSFPKLATTEPEKNGDNVAYFGLVTNYAPSYAFVDNPHSKQGSIGLPNEAFQVFSRERLQEALKNSGDAVGGGAPVSVSKSASAAPAPPTLRNTIVLPSQADAEGLAPGKNSDSRVTAGGRAGDQTNTFSEQAAFRRRYGVSGAAGVGGRVSPGQQTSPSKGDVALWSAATNPSDGRPATSESIQQMEPKTGLPVDSTTGLPIRDAGGAKIVPPAAAPESLGKQPVEVTEIAQKDSVTSPSFKSEPAPSLG